MTRVKIAALAAAVIIPLGANAGEIFGVLKESGKPVGAGVKMEVKANGKAYATQTDAGGGFRLFIEPEGKFPLTVLYKNKSPVLNVVSFEGSVRYDLVLEQAGGEYVLKRQ